jgi:hypothetical protein
MMSPVSSNPSHNEQWVVTSADDRVYEDLLVPFLGSLFTLAKWTGRVAVLDYGLAPARVTRLRRFGVVVEEVQHTTFVNLDRFLQLGSFCRRHPGLVSHWDADMWFCGGLGKLFDRFEPHYGHRLVCCIDRVFQPSCYNVAFDLSGRRKVQRILRGICRKYGNILQCAFLCGTSSAVAEFCEYLQELILSQEYKPAWNSDTVGLNYFCHDYPDRVQILPPHYNCLPDWEPRLRGKRFYLKGRPVRVMHVTSPYRADTPASRFLFQTVHPRLYRRWLAALSTS